MGKAEQQFEHLTDAQIEHYGDRTSGEGPNQNGLEIDQAIETHLAACDGCRIRVLEFHRSRFGLMSDPSSSAPSYSRPNSQGSPDSSRSAETGSMSSLSPTNLDLLYLGRSDEHRPTPDCPTADALRDLAAGLSSADGPRLTQHAAQCPHCGPILRSYTEDFSDDLSPEDQALLSKLKSSSPEWQKKMAQQMAAAVSLVSATGDARVAQPPSAVRLSSKQPPKRSFQLPRLKWFLFPAGAIACAVIAFFIWNAQRATPEKVEKLLAQAYTEQRTIALRVPTAAWGPHREERGQESSFSSPELQEAKAQIATQLKQDPSNLAWVQKKAEAELLEWKADLALRALERVRDSGVDSVPLRLDLALAHFERAERSSKPSEYGVAVELLSQILREDPQNEIARFNRALIYEKISFYHEAEADWEAYLQLHPTGDWANEARTHLDSIKKNSLRRDRRYLLRPSSWSPDTANRFLRPIASKNILKSLLVYG